LDAPEARLDHAVDRVVAAASQADDPDDGVICLAHRHAPLSLEEVLEYVPYLVQEPAVRTALLLDAPRRGGDGAPLCHAETYQTDSGGVRGAGHDVGQSGHAVGLADPDRQAEAFVGDLVDAGHQRGAAGDDDVACQQFQRAHALLDVALHQVEDLDDAWLDDLRQFEGGDAGGVVGVGHFQLDVTVGQFGQRHAVAALDALRFVGLYAQQLADVLGDVIAAQRDDRRVREGAAAEHPDV